MVFTASEESSVMQGLKTSAEMLRQYQDAAARQGAYCALAEESCRNHRMALTKRIEKVSHLKQLLDEEYRCLEAQDRELLTQLSAIAKRRNVVHSETVSVTEAMAAAPSLSREERQVQQQCEAVEARVSEMEELLDAVNQRIESVAADERELARKEAALAEREVSYESKRRTRRAKELELENRREQVLARERSINSWNHKLDRREQELALAQSAYNSRLSKLQGATTGDANSNQGSSATTAQPLTSPNRRDFHNAPSQKVRLQNMHNMSIDRSEEDEDDQDPSTHPSTSLEDCD